MHVPRHRHRYINTHMYVYEYMVGSADPTAHANPFPKNVPLMGGLNKKNKCLVLLCFTFIVFLT